MVLTNILLGIIIILLIVLIMVVVNIYENSCKKQCDNYRQDNQVEGYFSSLSIYEGNFLINSIKGKLKIMALELTNTQQASGVLTFKDKKLAVTDVPDGAVTLTSSDENVFTASYEDATNTVTVKAVNTGVAALTITATNKAGNNIPFEDIAIEVKSGDAETGSVEFGTPTEQE
jgi:hypothetical protein